MTTETERRAYSIKEARHKIGVCNASLYNLLNSGELPARKLGKRTVILADDLDQYLASLPAYQARAGVRATSAANSPDAIGAVLGKSLQNRAA